MLVADTASAPSSFIPFLALWQLDSCSQWYVGSDLSHSCVKAWNAVLWDSPGFSFLYFLDQLLQQQDNSAPVSLHPCMTGPSKALFILRVTCSMSDKYTSVVLSHWYLGFICYCNNLLLTNAIPQNALLQINYN